MIAIARHAKSEGPKQGAERVPRQIELPLKVPVCAWCRPKELGDRPGAVSQGICPRHFRKLVYGLRAGLTSLAADAAISQGRDSHRLVQAELAPP